MEEGDSTQAGMDDPLLDDELEAETQVHTYTHTPRCVLMRACSSQESRAGNKTVSSYLSSYLSVKTDKKKTRELGHGGAKRTLAQPVSDTVQSSHNSMS